MPDDRLLLDCLRPTPATHERLRGARSEDWEQLVRAAKALRVGGLVFRRLSSAGALGHVPSPTAGELQREYYATAALNLRRYHALTFAVQVLERAGIDVIILKGAHLARFVYGDLGVRPMSDVDILVRRQDVEPAFAALSAAGYRTATPFHMESELAGTKHLPPLENVSGAAMEVHWRVSMPNDPWRIDPCCLWERAAPASLDGRPVQVLSPEDLLLHLCMHAAKHHFSAGLLWLCDVQQVVTGGVRWDAVASRALEFAAERPTALTLTLARDLLGAAVPAHFPGAILAGSLPADVLESASARLLDPGAEVTPFADAWTRKGVFRGSASLVRRIFLPRAVLARVYGIDPDSWKANLYYAVRLRDALARRSRVFLGLLRRDGHALADARSQSTLAAWLGLPDM